MPSTTGCCAERVGGTSNAYLCAPPPNLFGVHQLKRQAACVEVENGVGRSGGKWVDGKRGGCKKTHKRPDRERKNVLKFHRVRRERPISLSTAGRFYGLRPLTVFSEGAHKQRVRFKSYVTRRNRAHARCGFICTFIASRCPLNHDNNVFRFLKK